MTPSPDLPPTAAEINADGSGDAEHAVKRFLGKTVEDAEKLLGNHISLSFTEDLDWMGPVAFRYYVRSAIIYARSDRSIGDSDFVNGFAGCLRRKLDLEPGELVTCAALLREVCDYIVHHFDRYAAEPETYVGLRAEYERLLHAFTQLSYGDRLRGG